MLAFRYTVRCPLTLSAEKRDASGSDRREIRPLGAMQHVLVKICKGPFHAPQAHCRVRCGCRPPRAQRRRDRGRDLIVIDSHTDIDFGLQSTALALAESTSRNTDLPVLTAWNL